MLLYANKRVHNNNDCSDNNDIVIYTARINAMHKKCFQSNREYGQRCIVNYSVVCPTTRLAKGGFHGQIAGLLNSSYF